MNPAAEPLVLLGAGGTAREAVDLVTVLIQAGAGFRIVAALDDDVSLTGSRIHGIEIAGPLANTRLYPPDTCFIDTLGSPRNFSQRPAIISALGIPDHRFATLIHPQASVSASASVGPGSLVFAFATVGANATLGSHVTILPHGVVSHDAIVGDWTQIATGAIVSGAAHVGRCCYLGAGSTLIDSARVGDGALVGMGSVVLKEVPSGAVVAGNPARILRSIEPSAHYRRQ